MTRLQRPAPLNEEISTDPYGHLTWAIGSGEDFWCFDYHRNEDGTFTLHAVINSDTGHFLQDAEPPVTVPEDRAVAEAQRLMAAALDWGSANDIEHDTEGWNQDASYFWRCVQRAVTGSPEPVPRVGTDSTEA